MKFESENSYPFQNINRIKNEIKSRVFKSRKWCRNGFQLSICFSGEEQSSFNGDSKLNNKLLLLDFYELIFKEGNDYRLVFYSMRELITELDLHEDSREWIADAILMTTCCLREYEKLIKQEDQRLVVANKNV